MKTSFVIFALGLAAGSSGTQASAGFFLEGLKPYTQEPRCPDPHAKNKEECAPADTSYPEPEVGRPGLDVRTTTRQGAAPK